MKLPDALAPYASLLKWGIIALLALGLVGGGMKAGCAMQQGKVDKAESDSAKKSEALRAAAASFKQFAIRFEEIDAATAANVEEARQAQERGQAAAVAAQRAAKASAARVGKLEQALREERAKCADGDRPICGIPLS